MIDTTSLQTQQPQHLAISQPESESINATYIHSRALNQSSNVSGARACIAAEVLYLRAWRVPN